MTDQEQKLGELVKQHVVLDQMISKYSRDIDNIFVSTCPDKVASLTEALQYAGEVRKAKELKDQFVGMKLQANKQLSEVEAEIIQLVPVENTWIKVGNYAVGTYTDSWGGIHTKLEIRDWAEDLPKLHNRLNYP